MRFSVGVSVRLLSQKFVWPQMRKKYRSMGSTMSTTSTLQDALSQPQRVGTLRCARQRISPYSHRYSEVKAVPEYVVLLNGYRLIFHTSELPLWSAPYILPILPGTKMRSSNQRSSPNWPSSSVPTGSKQPRIIPNGKTWALPSNTQGRPSIETPSTTLSIFKQREEIFCPVSYLKIS